MGPLSPEQKKTTADILKSFMSGGTPPISQNICDGNFENDILKSFTLIKFWFELSHDFSGKVDSNVIYKCSKYFEEKLGDINNNINRSNIPDEFKKLFQTLYARGISKKDLEKVYYSEMTRFSCEYCEGMDKLNIFRYIEITDNLHGFDIDDLQKMGEKGYIICLLSDDTSPKSEQFSNPIKQYNSSSSQTNEMYPQAELQKYSPKKYRPKYYIFVNSRGEPPNPNNEEFNSLTFNPSMVADIRFTDNNLSTKYLFPQFCRCEPCTVKINNINITIRCANQDQVDGFKDIISSREKINIPSTIDPENSKHFTIGQFIKDGQIIYKDDNIDSISTNNKKIIIDGMNLYFSLLNSNVNVTNVYLITNSGNEVTSIYSVDTEDEKCQGIELTFDNNDKLQLFIRDSTIDNISNFIEECCNIIPNTINQIKKHIQKKPDKQSSYNRLLDWGKITYGNIRDDDTLLDIDRFKVCIFMITSLGDWLQVYYAKEYSKTSKLPVSIWSTDKNVIGESLWKNLYFWSAGTGISIPIEFLDILDNKSNETITIFKKCPTTKAVVSLYNAPEMGIKEYIETKIYPILIEIYGYYNIIQEDIITIGAISNVQDIPEMESINNIPTYFTLIKNKFNKILKNAYNSEGVEYQQSDDIINILNILSVELSQSLSQDNNNGVYYL